MLSGFDFRGGTGFPIAYIPKCGTKWSVPFVETTGYMIAAVSVTSPIINDIIGSLESVRIGVNSHVHAGVQSGGSVTGPITSPIT